MVQDKTVVGARVLSVSHRDERDGSRDETAFAGTPHVRSDMPGFSTQRPAFDLSNFATLHITDGLY